MLLGIAAILLGSISGAADTGGATARLPQLFIAACLDGEARLAPGDAEPIRIDDLPRALRKRLRNPSSGQIWRLKVPGSAYLYVLNYQQGGKISPRICGLASDEMDYGVAQAAVQKRLTGEEGPKTDNFLQWTDAQAGYVAIAAKAEPFKILQINLMSDAQRAAARRLYRPLIP